MEDRDIMALYQNRNEQAIAETRKKYTRLCHGIAYHILLSHEDAEECENDAYFDAWQAIPPHTPPSLGSFVALLTRRRALDRYRKATAEKRRQERASLSLDELAECLPDHPFDDDLSSAHLTEVLNAFLKALPERDCTIFLRRYWYMDPIAIIAERFGYRESRVKMILKRTRDKLRLLLTKEDLF